MMLQEQLFRSRSVTAGSCQASRSSPASRKLVGRPAHSRHSRLHRQLSRSQAVASHPLSSLQLSSREATADQRQARQISKPWTRLSRGQSVASHPLSSLQLCSSKAIADQQQAQKVSKPWTLWAQQLLRQDSSSVSRGPRLASGTWLHPAWPPDCRGHRAGNRPWGQKRASLHLRRRLTYAAACRPRLLS